MASSSHLAADARVDGARLAGLRAAYGDLAAQLVDVFESTVADTLAELRGAVAAATRPSRAASRTGSRAAAATSAPAGWPT